MKKELPGVSVSNLLWVSLQNMMTLFFVNLMLFLDRVILAQHSSDALTTSVSASAYSNVFIFGAAAIACIAEVFVGRLNGAGKLNEIGRLMWQMLWFCLAGAALFNIIAFFGSPFLASHGLLSESAAELFSWQMACGILPATIACLNSFFIGTKRFGFALGAVVLASVIRLMLAIPLVFGIPGLTDGYGAVGCTMATAIGQVVHLAILLVALSSKRNCQDYGFFDMRIRPQLLWSVLKVGSPQSFGMMVNYAAWGVAISLLAAKGEKYLMMYTVVDSMYNLLGFSTEALQKSVLSVSANLIGSGRSHLLPRVFNAALMVLSAVMIFLAVPLLICPNTITKSIDSGLLSGTEMSLACLVVWIYFSLDGIGWVLSGVLTSLGDTLYVNPVNGVASFVVGAGSTFVMTNVMSCSVSVTCWISVLYGMAYALVLLMRFKTWVTKFDKKTISLESEDLCAPLMVTAPIAVV